MIDFDIINKILSELKHTLTSLPQNEIFIGLVFAGMFSVTMYVLRNVPKIFLNFIRNNLTIYTTFTNYTADHVLNYIETLPTVFGPKSFDVSLNETRQFKLGEGKHFKKYKNKIMYVDVAVKFSEFTGDHYLTLRLTFFTRDNRFLKELIEDVTNHMYNYKIKLLVSEGFYWRFQKSIDVRPDESLFYPNNLKDEIYNDLEWWLNSKDYYKKIGIPYRRGYLFHGKPGTGKSSIIPIIANRMNANTIHYLDISQTLNNSQLIEIFSGIHDNSILVIEDIDVALSFNNRDNNEVDKNGNNKGVTFSGLLNVFDGLIASENFLVIFTTNHIENIDPALIRCGRIDKRFEFPLMDFDSLKRMRDYYEVNVSDNELRKWENVEPAKIQNEFLKLTMNNADDSKLLYLNPSRKSQSA